MKKKIFALVLALVSTLAAPLFHVSGDDMSPALRDGDVAAVLKGRVDGTGAVCAFYAGDGVSFARVIARAGSWVNVDDDGHVFVDGRPLDEPYATLSAAGDVLLTRLQAAVGAEFERNPDYCHMRIALAQHGNEAGVLGAAALAASAR